MSVFDRLAPLIPQVSSSSRQTKEQPSACLSPPLALSSPVIKRKPIHIPSFDERGLIYDKHNTKQVNADRSFVPICPSKSSSRPSWIKPCQHSQRSHGERASTLPRTKPKTHSSPTLPAKPSISIFPAPQPNSSPTLKPKPSDSLHLPASQLSDPSPLLHQPQPKPSVSPTLTVPTPRLTPSPTLDGRGGKQPSPVARERRARSITISNTKAEPSKERPSNVAKHDVLDQEALMDFTHPMLRKVCPHESQREIVKPQDSYLLQEKVSLSKKERPKPPPRNTDITANAKPKSNIKQQQEFLPSGAAGTQTSLSESEGIKFAYVHRETQPVFDGPTTQSSLHRKFRDYAQSRTSGFTSNERIYSERNMALPVTPRMRFSTESTVSPHFETRRRQFGFNNKTTVDTTFVSGAQETHTIRTTSSKLWLKAQSQTSQTDVKGAVSQSDCVSKDYSCHSRGIDQKMEASPQSAHRLNRLTTCLVAPRTQEASQPASVDCTTSKTTFSKPDIIPHKHQLDHKQPPGSHKGENLSDTVNQTDISAPSDHHEAPTKLPEYPSEKSNVSWSPPVARCPFNTNSFGISSKGVSDLPCSPQHRVCQRPDGTTTASPPPYQPNYSPADRAFIMEEPEDPYYVTMYYPGSVYVGGGHSAEGVVKGGFKTLLLIRGVTDVQRRDVTTLVSRLLSK